MKKLIVGLWLLASTGLPSHAFTDGRVVLEGKVRSFDHDVVKMASGKNTIVIPKRLVPISDLKVDAVIRVEIPSRDVSSIKYEK